MLTSQIEQAANRGDLAGGDFEIGLVLRSQCIPAFLEDVGRIGWRTKLFPFTMLVGQQAATLPADFFEVESVYINGQNDGIFYVGEDPILVAQAEAQTWQATANGEVGYYLLPDTLDPTRTALKLNTPSGTVQPMMVSYYWYIPFADSTQDVDLKLYFPEQYHWALVELLRREIIDDRYGQGDERFATADGKYKEWLKRIGPKRELAPKGNRANYMR